MINVPSQRAGINRFMTRTSSTMRPRHRSGPRVNVSTDRGWSFPDEFLEAAPRGADVASARQPAEDVAQFVRREPLRAGPFDEVLDRTIPGVADPDPVLPSRVPNGVAAALRCVVRPADSLIGFRV